MVKPNQTAPSRASCLWSTVFAYAPEPEELDISFCLASYEQGWKII